MNFGDLPWLVDVSRGGAFVTSVVILALSSGAVGTRPAEARPAVELLVEGTGGVTTATLRVEAGDTVVQQSIDLPVSWGGCSCFAPPEPPKPRAVTAQSGLLAAVAGAFLARRRARHRPPVDP